MEMGIKWSHGIGVEIDAIKDGVVEASVEYSYRTHEGYNGPILIQGSQQGEASFGVFKKWDFNLVKSIKDPKFLPALKVGGKAEVGATKSVVADVNFGAAFLLGIEVDVKIGWESQ